MKKALVASTIGTVDVTPWITEIVPLVQIPDFLNTYDPSGRRDSVKSIA